MNLRTVSVVSVLAGAALIGIAALAQTPPPPPPQQPPGQSDMRRVMRDRMCADMPARFAGRVAYTEVKLGITDAQKPAWQTFATEAKAALAPMQKLCATPPAANAGQDAAADLARREVYLTAALDSTKALRLAVEKLSPTLTEAQRKTLAETLVRRMGGRGMGPDGGRHGHGHGGHGPQGMRPGMPAGPAPAGAPPATK